MPKEQPWSIPRLELAAIPSAKSACRPNLIGLQEPCVDWRIVSLLRNHRHSLSSVMADRGRPGPTRADRGRPGKRIRPLVTRTPALFYVVKACERFTERTRHCTIVKNFSQPSCASQSLCRKMTRPVKRRLVASNGILADSFYGWGPRPTATSGNGWLRMARVEV